MVDTFIDGTVYVMQPPHVAVESIGWLMPDAMVDRTRLGGHKLGWYCLGLENRECEPIGRVSSATVHAYVGDDADVPPPLRSSSLSTTQQRTSLRLLSRQIDEGRRLLFSGEAATDGFPSPATEVVSSHDDGSFLRP
ncbi:hypothetical protein PIB30_073307 [Stylosanthes scabra]|uniref:Uncharacterized protein n=1 Tax=Stylosanthes scabra TaxID=79078 RepID=A0ABU6ZN69_9FABA|nr:hypothetical protein [Stylosanthes scabra]